MNKITFPSIKVNFFKTQETNQQQTQNAQQPAFSNNPFKISFKSALNADMFQNSSLKEENSTNFVMKKIAEFTQRFNAGMEIARNKTREMFQPVISFAGKVKEGYNTLNSITLTDAMHSIGKEISLLTLDKDVRKYVKMPTYELRGLLEEELKA
ncbi:MAG: hypothetical protein PHX18_07945 [Candidatus Gastranaerophilales bacterium]|nr:hypothetical protein [Candidatus Gastranaerophilales bacterium]